MFLTALPLVVLNIDAATGKPTMLDAGVVRRGVLGTQTILSTYQAPRTPRQRDRDCGFPFTPNRVWARL
jgi:hypothetical protein